MKQYLNWSGPRGTRSAGGGAAFTTATLEERLDEGREFARVPLSCGLDLVDDTVNSIAKPIIATAGLTSLSSELTNQVGDGPSNGAATSSTPAAEVVKDLADSASNPTAATLAPTTGLELINDIGDCTTQASPSTPFTSTD